MAKGHSLAVKSILVQGNIQFGGLDMYEMIEAISKAKKWFDDNCDMYACMLHDMCLKDDGTPKTPHLHFVGHLKRTSKGSPRLSTTLNAIAKACDVNTLAVSIFAPQNIEGAVQYFTHQAYPNKTQYPKERFITNIAKEELDIMLSSDVKPLDDERIIEVVASAYCRSDVLREIGLYYYRMYRGVINDLWQEFHEAPRSVDKKRERKQA